MRTVGPALIGITIGLLIVAAFALPNPHGDRAAEGRTDTTAMFLGTVDGCRLWRVFPREVPAFTLQRCEAAIPAPWLDPNVPLTPTPHGNAVRGFNSLGESGVLTILKDAMGVQHPHKPPCYIVKGAKGKNGAGDGGDAMVCSDGSVAIGGQGGEH